MSERSKEPVLKTGDVRASVGSNPTLSSIFILLIFVLFVSYPASAVGSRQTRLEKYSRGRRGAPAKGVGRATGARVQIPPSPPNQKPHKHLQIKCLCGFSSFSHPVKLRSKRLKKATPSCQKVVSLTRHVLSKTAPFFSPANKH